MPIKYTVVEMSEDDLEQERRAFGGLAQSVRELAEASLRTTVPTEVATEVLSDPAALGVVAG